MNNYVANWWESVVQFKMVDYINIQLAKIQDNLYTITIQFIAFIHS